MKTFNVVFTGDSAAVVAALTAAGITVNKTLVFSKVLNVSANDMSDLLSFGLTLIEEEKTVTPVSQLAWQQIRVSLTRLPLSATTQASYRGRGQVIYLVDSGVDSTHPELSDASIVQLHSFDSSSDDTIGHGTTLATIIAGKTIGISPLATIKVVKIPKGEAIPVTTLLEALEAVLKDHQLNRWVPSVKVVNCSWIVDKSLILDTKISELEAAGLVVVAAAGNQGVAADNFSPVGLDSVLGVGASDAYDRMISWAPGSASNFGTEVDVTAPGIDVDVITASGTRSVVSGTSAAAAVTSAVVCHFIEHFPIHTAAQIQDIVLDYTIQDAVFRNESIYNTTPNRLLHTLSVGDIGNLCWGVDRPSKLFVQRSGIAQLAIPFIDPIKSIEFKDITFANGFEYRTPSWATIVDKTVAVTPPSSLPAGIYPVLLTGTDVHDNQYVLQIKIGVYNTSPSELDAITTEQYLNPQGEFVHVSFQFCTDDSQCNPPITICDTGTAKCVPTGK